MINTMNTMQRAKYNDEYNEKSKANTYLLVIYQYDLVKLLLCNILTVTHSLKFQNFKNGWLSSDIYLRSIYSSLIQSFGSVIKTRLIERFIAENLKGVICNHFIRKEVSQTKGCRWVLQFDRFHQAIIVCICHR